MRTLTASEKRTIRYAAIGISIYLVLFFGIKFWKVFEHRRRDYLQMVAEARLLKAEAGDYTDKAAVVKKLMDEFQFDPAKISSNSVVADASAAIQKAAMSGGIQPGPIRESPGRSADKELAAIQFEGAGQVSSVLSLLHQIPLLGYPLIIDSLQITPDKTRPGQIKLTLNILVLDFDQWKKKKVPDA
jgi:hypothetical protein